MKVEPLLPLFTQNFKAVVLWFGEDVFCQMNVITLLAFLEQLEYKGQVFLNSFHDDEFKVNQTELQLGSFQKVYQDVLIQHRSTISNVLPVMYQAIELFLSMQNDHNAVTK